MSNHKYILEPYKGMSTRYRCPSCNQNKIFTLYINNETNEYIHGTVGRCNRSDNCGYHYTPKQYFTDNKPLFETNITDYNQKYSQANKNKILTLSVRATSFISFEVLKASLNKYKTNHFVQFLMKLFGEEITSKAVRDYFIATSKYWDGATVFWQIDTQGKIRTGKIMIYSPTTGKRMKNRAMPVYWVHKALRQPEFELKQCLFGEHLLIDKTKPVAIVESEKTAVIASVYLPQFIWVAVGSLTNLNTDKCSVLKGRNVTLFPDLNGFEKWSNKAKELSHLAIFTVSDLLERKATEAEKKQGFDLADYLIKFNYKEFKLPAPEATEPPPIVQKIIEANPIKKKEPVINSYIQIQKTQKNWNKDIAELENYFTSIPIPTQPVKLNKYSTITNYSLFIESHFTTVKTHNGNRTFLPYLKRLQELKQVLTTNL